MIDILSTGISVLSSLLFAAACLFGAIRYRSVGLGALSAAWLVTLLCRLPGQLPQVTQGWSIDTHRVFWLVNEIVYVLLFTTAIILLLVDIHRRTSRSGRAALPAGMAGPPTVTEHRF